MPISSVLIRGMANHPQPHVLVRPDNRIARASHTPAIPGIEPQAHVRTFEQGFAEGLARGIEQGVAQSKAEAEEHNRAFLEQARGDAVAAGLAEGLQRGHDQAQARAAQLQDAFRLDASARLARLDALIGSMSIEVGNVVAAAEDELVAITHDSICRMLGETATRPEVVGAMVSGLVSAHGKKKNVQIHLHPQDLSLVTECKSPATGAQWSCVADEGVELGGVLLRSPEGSLDARLETQLQAVRRCLLTLRSERAAAAHACKEETS